VSGVYDVAVVGLGAMGSAAAYHLARRDVRVLGLDRFHPPHDFGSSHGRTRIIREAYFEDPSYVPLVQRAYELWAELEKESGRKLFLQTGGLMLGPADGVLVSGARRSAEQHALKHELLTSEQIRARFPALAAPNGLAAVWEPRAGILFPELAIQTHLELAKACGAELCFDSPVMKWEPGPDGLQVHTSTGIHRAKQVVLSPGAWMNSLLPPPGLPLSIERQVLYWFAPIGDGAAFEASRLPIFIWEYASHKFFYGFPDLGEGVKFALHHQGDPAEPNSLSRDVQPEEVEMARGLLRRFIPGAAGALQSAVACMYTNAPDEHFILDRHPALPQVVIASPCSGHGFKFSPVIGELIAGMISGEGQRLDTSLYKLDRFTDDGQRWRLR
jgi:sarcosine oxidase